MAVHCTLKSILLRSQRVIKPHQHALERRRVLKWALHNAPEIECLVQLQDAAPLAEAMRNAVSSTLCSSGRDSILPSVTAV
jgi:hypothetical protein